MPETLIAVKYRIYPSKAQQTLLRQMLATCCEVYNSLVHWRRYDYEVYQTTLSYRQQQDALPHWKQQHPQLSEVHSQVLQNVCKRVELAYQAYFRRLQDYCQRKAKGRLKEGEKAPGRPRLKGEGHYDSLTYPQAKGFLVGSDCLSVSKIGIIKAVIHRPLPGKPKTCTLRLHCGKWYACISCQIQAQALPASEEKVGIDVGVHYFAATSDGDTIENPRFFRKEEKALKKAQRKVERFSKVRKDQQQAKLRKAKNALAKVHERIANKRHDFLHQEAHKLVKRYGLIAIEELNVDNLLARPKPKHDSDTGQYLPNGASQKSGLNKSIADAAWSRFRAILTQQAERAGRLLIAVNPAFTSQNCSGCGTRVEKTLEERRHVCTNPDCGLVLDRDGNAARNILKLALYLIAVGRYSVTVRPCRSPRL